MWWWAVFAVYAMLTGMVIWDVVKDLEKKSSLLLRIFSESVCACPYTLCMRWWNCAEVIRIYMPWSSRRAERDRRVSMWGYWVTLTKWTMLFLLWPLLLLLVHLLWWGARLYRCCVGDELR